VRRRPPSRAAGAALATAILLFTTAACGGDDGVGEDRAAQVRDAAVDAGLPGDVADVLALAARGATATFQVTYAGQDGAEVTVSQAPPDRRVDAVTAGLIVQSQVVRDGVAYRCELPADGKPGDPLDCTRTEGAIPAQGAFTPEALTAFTEELGSSVETMDLTVEERTIADVAATCLVAAPVAGTPLDGTGPGVDTICLSAEGAQLLVDVGGERLVATTYTTDVPAGTFDV
jgi:hypothetical protein